MSQNRRAVVSFCNSNGNYRKGMERLRQSLIGRFDGDFLGFEGEESVGAPKHEDTPYGFKIYCIEKAIALGYTSILWLDASVFAIKDLTPIFEVIESEGYIMQDAGHFLGNWCNDSTLEAFGVTRQEAMEMPMYGNAGFLGLDFSKDIANSFLNSWRFNMDKGLFKGSWDNHRHDMSVGTLIAYMLNMKYKSGDKWLEYAAPGTVPKNETIILQANGM